MRIPTWFVMIWVVVCGVAAIGGALLTYTVVRDNAEDWDKVSELPDLPQVGRSVSEPDAGDSASQAADDPTPAAADSQNPLDGEADSTPAPADLAASAETDPAAEPGAGNDAEPDADAALESDLGVDLVPVQDPRRTNVLLLGIDQREGEQGPFPTDTIILLSLHPVQKTGAILSIPRDLWVEMPGLGQYDRINSANIRGEMISYPGGGGPAYAVEVVESLLGIGEIDYYVVINFEVFYTVIDAIGPIEVCPEEEIFDDSYPDGSYGYITVHFPAGCQELDSERLLQYARTRHADSDIGRSARQQEVILNVREKILSAGSIIDLLPEAASIWRSMQDNIRTNMTFQDIVSLALTAESVPDGNIRQGQISFGEVNIGESPDGDQYLSPISSDIQLLLEDLFRPPDTASNQETSDTTE